jgi:hypothetical protein
VAGNEPSSRNWLLIVGVALVLLAAVGFLLGRAWEGVSGFLFLGVVLVIVGVFEPRMEGRQVFGWRQAEINLAKVTSKADTELEEGKVLALEEAK